MRHFLAAIGSVSLLLAAAPAFATVRNFTANLNAFQEGNFNTTHSPATGTATVTIDDVTGDVTVNGTFSGLLFPSTVAHIHGLSPFAGPAAPVLITLTVPAGVTSGTITGSGNYGANLSAALGGQTYVNVHSNGPNTGGGEIRGQILPAPTAPAVPPWGIALLTLSMAGVGALFVARRRGMAAAK